MTKIIKTKEAIRKKSRRRGRERKEERPGDGEIKRKLKRMKGPLLGAVCQSFSNRMCGNRS